MARKYRGAPYGELFEDLKFIRRYGTDHICDANILIAKMGYSPNTKIALIQSGLITLIQEIEQNPIDKELLLLSLGLLQGYDSFTEIGKRRDEYYLNGYPANWTDDHRSLLHKSEDRAIEKFAKRLANIDDISSIIAKAPKTLRLPKAEYPEKAMWSRAGRPLFAFHNYFPIQKTPHFTGRMDVLAQIHAKFNAEQDDMHTQVLSGLGGVGKTQIALEYISLYGSDYDMIWWLTADSEESLLSAVTDFANRKGLAPESSSETVIADAFVEWLENHTNWLLVFDNVEDMETVRRFRPQQNKGGGHILVTTRLTDINMQGLISVDVFDKDTAVGFLLTRAGGADEVSAEVLANRLGCLPLALEQAASYITAWLSGDFIKYLTLLEEHGLEVFGAEYDANIEKYYKQTVVTTWKISMEKIQMVSAKELLYICAYFAPETINYSVFILQAEFMADYLDQTHEAFFETFPKQLGLDLLHSLKRNKIIAELVRYSLVKYDTDTEMISIHRLLQEVIRDELGENPTYLKCALAIIPIISDCVDQAFVHLSNIDKGHLIRSLAHVYHIVNHGEALLPGSLLLMTNASIGYHLLGALMIGYDVGLPYLYKALEYAQKSEFNDEEHLSAITATIEIAAEMKKPPRLNQ